LHWQQRAEVAGFLLNLPSFAKLVGEVGFIYDLLSLLFLGCIHTLLPSLNEHKMDNEAALLHNVLYMHTVVASEYPPSHRFFLQSQFFDAIGRREEARTALLNSLQTAALRDHEWITKAQSYWAALLEAGREDAIDFVLLLYRNAPEAHLAEIKEMIALTFLTDAATGRRRFALGDSGTRKK
jgi:hypothetical protein